MDDDLESRILARMVRALPFGDDIDRLDRRIGAGMDRFALPALRLGLALCFLWFGALKFVPGLSPEEELVGLTLPMLPLRPLLAALGTWEVLIGFGLLSHSFRRLTLLLLFLQLPGTALPLVLLPDVCFHEEAFALTLEGQYIVKNLVMVGAGLMIGAGVHADQPGDGPGSP